jgi:glutathione gamma-glutamylcysteinyltransferase
MSTTPPATADSSPVAAAAAAAMQTKLGESIGQTAAPIAKPIPSFYRRPLPDTCIALSSREGKRLFKSALLHGGLKSFFPLVEQHATQTEPAYCGISTLTVCLNAFAVDPRQNWKGPWRWYEESMLNCCMDLDEVKKTGITMRVFHCLAQCQGLSSHVFYVEDEMCTLEHLREQVRKACDDDKDDESEDKEAPDLAANGNGEGRDGQLRHVLVASYNRQTLGQSGTGHFSPIGAYDSASDSVLILDTARFKYGAHWVSLPLLYEAMKSVDPDSGRSRGYILLTHDADDHPHGYSSGSPSHSPSSTALPISILFRTRMKQYEARREYKHFLKSLEHEPTWDDVVRFWTRDWTSRDYVWTSVDAQVKPCSNDVATLSLLQRVRALIAASIPSHAALPRASERTFSSSCVSSCRPNGLRSLDLKPEEAIFVAYLAALDEDRRRHVVEDAARSSCNSSSPTGDSPDEEAVLQLLAEAELVRYAIDLSDQQPTMTT